LGEERIIIIKKDRDNSQTHRLFINNENMFVSMMQEIESFKLDFFRLIDEVALRCTAENLGSNSDLIYGLLLFYKHFIIKYTIGDLFHNDEKETDKEILHKKFTVVFKTIQEMRTRSEKLLNKTLIDDSETIKSELIQGLLFESSEFRIRRTLEVLEEFGLSKIGLALWDKNLSGFCKDYSPEKIDA
jgi:hypothetical protein